MYCINHIAQLGRMSADLDARGFKVLVIGRSAGKAAKETADAFAGKLELLTDPELMVYQLYEFEKVALVVQKSGVVVVDKNGTIRYVHRSANPKSSLKKQELVQALDTIE